MTRTVTLMAMISAGLLAGCAGMPRITPQSRQVAAPALGLADQSVVVAHDWWVALGDPQLDRIMADALAGSPTLDAAMARLRVAQAGVAAQHAGLLPQASVNGLEQRQRLSGTYIYPPPYAGTGQWVGTVEADIGWSLDLAGRQKAMVDQARASARAAALDAAAARVALSGAVGQTYVNLVRADARIGVAAEFIASRQAALNLALARQHSHLASDFDIRTAQTLLAEAEQAKVRAEGQRAAMIHALAALAGRGADYYATITAPSLAVATMLPIPHGLPADLLARRPDIQAAQARIDAAQAGRRMARAQFYPDVDIRAFVGSAALGLGALFTGSAVTAGIGPAVHLPLFEGGQLKAQYGSAVGQLDVAVAEYNQLVIQAIKQAADGISAVETNAADARQQQLIVADLKDTLRLDAIRMHTGLSSRVAILDGNDRWLAARQAQVDLDADGAVSRIQLLIALGGGFTPLPPPAGPHSPPIVQSQAPGAAVN